MKINEVEFSDDDVLNIEDYEYTKKAFLLHDHGFVQAVVFADSENEALDAAAESGKLEAWLAEDELVEELDKHGMADGYTFLGNSCDPYELDTLSVLEIPKPENLSFVGALEREDG